VLWTSKLHFNKRGEVTFIDGIARDITEFKKAENETKRIFDLSPSVLCVVSSEGKLIKANPEFSKVLGWSNEELLSKPLFDFIHPDDHETTLGEIEKQKKGQDTLYFENRYLCKDGSYKTLAWRAIAVIDDGTLHGAATDITAKKITEEQIARYTKELEKKNNALRELMDNVERKSNINKINVEININKNILPIIERMKSQANYSKVDLDELEHNVANINSGFYASLIRLKHDMSQQEMRICQFVNEGLQEKEIASKLNISVETIKTHKKRIRKKLGLTNKPVKLKTFLENHR
jgi:PAS domain S-box-containing protein